MAWSGVSGTSTGAQFHLCNPAPSVAPSCIHRPTELLGPCTNVKRPSEDRHHGEGSVPTLLFLPVWHMMGAWLPLPTTPAWFKEGEVLDLASEVCPRPVQRSSPHTLLGPAWVRALCTCLAVWKRGGHRSQTVVQGLR